MASCAQRSPRAYQLRARDAFVNAPAGRNANGVIVLPCGSGKTFIGVLIAEAMVRRHRSALGNSLASLRVIVASPMQHIRDSWLAEMEKVKGVDCVSVCYSGIGDNSSNPEYDLMLLDEVHRLGANTFLDSIKAVKAGLVVGFTGTPFRMDDEFEAAMQQVLKPGYRCFDQPWKPLEKDAYIAKLQFAMVECGVTAADSFALGDPVSAPGDHVFRSLWLPSKLAALEQILDRHVRQWRQSVLVYVPYKVVAERYVELFKLFGYDEDVVICLHADTPNLHRKYQKLKYENNRLAPCIIVATTIADEGLDIDYLQAVVMMTVDNRSPTQFTQRAGRLTRLDPLRADKTAQCYVMTHGPEERDRATEGFAFLRKEGYAMEVVRCDHQLSEGVLAEVNKKRLTEKPDSLAQ